MAKRLTRADHDRILADVIRKMAEPRGEPDFGGGGIGFAPVSSCCQASCHIGTEDPAAAHFFICEACGQPCDRNGGTTAPVPGTRSAP